MTVRWAPPLSRGDVRVGAWWRRWSLAAALLDDHVVERLHDDVAVVVDVEQVERRQLGGRAARRRHEDRVDGVHLHENYLSVYMPIPLSICTNEALHDGVIRGICVARQRVVARAVAEVRVVAARRHHPALPADRREVDVHAAALARRRACSEPYEPSNPYEPSEPINHRTIYAI